uniref:Uncharacterized protein n=1 Tax=Knipowitschia caucasica TaxID=637954 RepID=A0AAV2LDF8_KNICA
MSGGSASKPGAQVVVMTRRPKHAVLGLATAAGQGVLAAVPGIYSAAGRVSNGEVHGVRQALRPGDFSAAVMGTSCLSVPGEVVEEDDLHVRLFLKAEIMKTPQRPVVIVSRWVATESFGTGPVLRRPELLRMLLRRGVNLWYYARWAAGGLFQTAWFLRQSGSGRWLQWSGRDLQSRTLGRGRLMGRGCAARICEECWRQKVSVGLQTGQDLACRYVWGLLQTGGWGGGAVAGRRIDGRE